MIYNGSGLSSVQEFSKEVESHIFEHIKTEPKVLGGMKTKQTHMTNIT